MLGRAYEINGRERKRAKRRFTLRGRYRHQKRRPFPAFALHLDRSSMLVDDTLCNREPEARPLFLADGDKRFEDLFPDLVRDAAPGIRDGE